MIIPDGRVAAAPEDEKVCLDRRSPGGENFPCAQAKGSPARIRVWPVTQPASSVAKKRAAVAAADCPPRGNLHGDPVGRSNQGREGLSCGQRDALRHPFIVTEDVVTSCKKLDCSPLATCIRLVLLTAYKTSSTRDETPTLSKI
jgi:hypothetical protein